MEGARDHFSVLGSLGSYLWHAGLMLINDNLTNPGSLRVDKSRNLGLQLYTTRNLQVIHGIGTSEELKIGVSDA